MWKDIKKSITESLNNIFTIEGVACAASGVALLVAASVPNLTNLIGIGLLIYGLVLIKRKWK